MVLLMFKTVHTRRLNRFSRDDFYTGSVCTQWKARSEFLQYIPPSANSLTKRARFWYFQCASKVLRRLFFNSPNLSVFFIHSRFNPSQRTRKARVKYISNSQTLMRTKKVHRKMLPKRGHKLRGTCENLDTELSFFFCWSKKLWHIRIFQRRYAWNG